MSEENFKRVKPFFEFNPDRLGLGVQAVIGRCDNPCCTEAHSVVVEIVVLWWCFGVICMGGGEE